MHHTRGQRSYRDFDPVLEGSRPGTWFGVAQELFSALGKTVLALASARSAESTVTFAIRCFGRLRRITTNDLLDEEKDSSA